MTGDPRCPTCGRKVGATATRCLHCGSTFESPHGGDATTRRRYDPTAEGEASPSWLERRLRPVRASRKRVGVLVDLATRTDPTLTGYPTASEFCGELVEFLDASRDRRDAVAVVTSLILWAYAVMWAVPNLWFASAAGVVVAGYLVTRESVGDMASLATLAVGLLALAGQVLPGLARWLESDGWSLTALAAALALPMTVAVPFLLVATWLLQRRATDPTHQRA